MKERIFRSNGVVYDAMYFEFLLEYYKALKPLSYEQAGRIIMALAGEHFSDRNYVNEIPLTAEEKSILLSFKAIGELSNNI